ncbi:unnamed protein product [Microthlaspi erraticum]|uniref:Uncharacterized protein n=1 Tax=Microthlaspi erraticum TaxID=1685480 RepID=A0A6D2LC71_9BRAS|nr:unnamed protein product [Microthlaspi erraticum]
MATPHEASCRSCGLIRRHCQCHRQTSLTGSDKPTEITPACCCAYYISITLCLLAFPLICITIDKLFDASQISCFLELFAESVSVSNENANTNVSAADWRIGFVARSPVTGCKISLHTLKSRLLLGDQVISNSTSPSLDHFGRVVTGDKANLFFETVVMPEVTGDVVWDIRVEIIAGVKTDLKYGNGFLLVFCGDIPVKFTADPAGSVIGSLLGNIRRCDYLFRNNLNPYLESLRS